MCTTFCLFFSKGLQKFSEWFAAQYPLSIPWIETRLPFRTTGNAYSSIFCSFQNHISYHLNSPGALTNQPASRSSGGTSHAWEERWTCGQLLSKCVLPETGFVNHRSTQYYSYSFHAATPCTNPSWPFSASCRFLTTSNFTTSSWWLLFLVNYCLACTGLSTSFVLKSVS